MITKVFDVLVDSDDEEEYKYFYHKEFSSKLKAIKALAEELSKNLTGCISKSDQMHLARTMLTTTKGIVNVSIVHVIWKPMIIIAVMGFCTE